LCGHVERLVSRQPFGASSAVPDAGDLRTHSGA
jgi:hypothetical protein